MLDLACSTTGQEGVFRKGKDRENPRRLRHPPRRIARHPADHQFAFRSACHHLVAHHSHAEEGFRVVHQRVASALIVPLGHHAIAARRDPLPRGGVKGGVVNRTVVTRKQEWRNGILHRIYEVSSPRCCGKQKMQVMMWIWLALAVVLVFVFFQKRLSNKR